MPPRLLFIVTHPMTAHTLMRGQLRHLAQSGFEVALACSPGRQLDEVAAREGVPTYPVAMSREISPARDLRALWGLVRVIRAFRPALVHAGTPKAGLLGMIAARLCGVSRRLYTLRGLRLETVGGAKRLVLGLGERLAAASAQRVVCVSASLRRRYLEIGLAPPAKTMVLGAGSSNGVDVERFHPARRESAESAELRAALGLPAGEPVIGFVGRFTPDKGICDLAEVLAGGLGERFPHAHLLLVGDFETGHPVPREIAERLRRDPRVCFAGFVGDTALYYALFDVLVFPSYREGFPNAPLEAAAAGIPTVGYAATGTVDAVVHGVTGMLVAPGDRQALGDALCRYLADPELRRSHGAAARERAVREFRSELVWRAWAALYRELLA